MDLNKVKQLSARTLGVGVKRVRITNEERAAEAITRDDIRTLVREKVIVIKPAVGTSRGRARALAKRKKLGRGKGPGKRKGAKKARMGKKKAWMIKVRAQRKKLRELRPQGYRNLYLRVKGGFFKSVKHLESFVRGE